MRRATLLAVLLLGLAQTASASAATLTLSKGSSPPGTTISASGSGFGSGESVDIAFDGFVEAHATTDPPGNFSAVDVVVPTVDPGSHRFVATGRTRAGSRTPHGSR